MSETTGAVSQEVNPKEEETLPGPDAGEPEVREDGGRKGTAREEGQVAILTADVHHAQAGPTETTEESRDTQKQETTGIPQVDQSRSLEELGGTQRQEDVGNSTATVKVVLVPEGHVMTSAFAIGLRIQELKRHLAADLKVPVEVLQVSLDGQEVEEQQTLMELGVQPHSSTPMELRSTDPDSHPLRAPPPPEQDDMADVITVQVQNREGELQEVVVEVERSPLQKPFLGGFRHRLTGTEFHHAAVQTKPKRRPDRGVSVFNRDTQTVQLRSQVQQCRASAATQMTGIGCYVSCINDRLVEPGSFLTASEHHWKRLRAAICLQAHIRGWLSRLRVEQLRRERDRRLAWLDMQERRRQEEKEEQLRARRSRWMNPRRRDDFNLLYHALEKWRREEEQKINSSMRGARRKAALCALLEQEQQLIATIGCHRSAAYKNNYDTAVRNFLDKCAAPHRWRAADGRPIEMDTQQTLRAGQLRDLYHQVALFSISKEERLAILKNLKHTVSVEQVCPLGRDIMELVDRELDLMSRDIAASKLLGLRRRLAGLFLQLVRTPSFNPEVGKLLKVPQNPAELKSNMFQCRGCSRYLCWSDFGVSAGAVGTGRCRVCVRLDNIARSRDDLTSYKNMLRRLRVEEQKLSRNNKIPFLLQVEDLQYLVDVVWAARSVHNTCSDLYSLDFLRWEHRRDWSPWNCILLSRDEVPAHLGVENVEQVYEATFIHAIHQKHLKARRHFGQILSTAAAILDPPPDAAIDESDADEPTPPDQ